MGIVDFISRYFFVPPDGIYESQRRFYRDNLNGEDLHDAMRILDDMETEYKYFVRYLPTVASVCVSGVSLFTLDSSYLTLLTFPEGWRMLEMNNVFCMIDIQID